ncbi:hypothetical protein [Aliikangiella maris]|uniref:ApeI dehydratase-like domain-containing protein n=2 Tax=Aliikangiella maris TaxID=3162458 RepID=A0ABV3MPN7_9GAMM
MQTSNNSQVKRPFPVNFDFQIGEFDIADSAISAERMFADDVLVFEGHFPQNKILPGVMMIEYVLFLGETYLREKQMKNILTEILSARFLSPVTPGMKVNCHCEFAEKKGQLLMKATLSYAETIFARIKVSYGSAV